jgi:hypothetical protein
MAVGLALLLAGCSSQKREECRALSTLVNATADSIDKAKSSALDPSGLKSLADVLEKAATDTDALKLKVPETTKHAKDYAALLRDVANTCREMAAAGEAADQPKAEAAGQTMEKLVAGEPKLVAELNKFCSAE